ncbi:MAG: hypothetical protein N2234_09675 [Planctomycetota bacterium]|nr:hypothetical protein [Planctomycetota bacterium]
MKKLRVFLLIVNFALMASLGYLTLGYFITWDFFKEKTLSTLNPEEFLPPITSRRYIPWTVYEQTVLPLAEPPKEIEEPKEVKVDTTAQNLQQILSRIKVLCVIFDKKIESKRGLIADVDGNPFYIGVGSTVLENPLIVLKSVSELEAGKRYILKFTDKDGKDLSIGFNLE